MKQATLFDHLSNITDKKVPWEKLSEMDKKSWNPFMVGRFLSMESDLLEFVNFVEKYTIGVLSPKVTYKLYLDILPKRKFYLKYIKNMKQIQYEPELVRLLSEYFKTSTDQTIDYLNIYFETDSGMGDLKEILEKYGIDAKKIKTLLKIK